MRTKANTVLTGRDAQRYWVMRALQHYAEGLAHSEETAVRIMSLFTPDRSGEADKAGTGLAEGKG